ncbi:hypothetical protein NL108_008093 [Boleophthalmus pectinirostris]|nr:hypothetical protein NL108_008093 [Boleophthalmus pectinirostris]
MPVCVFVDCQNVFIPPPPWCIHLFFMTILFLLLFWDAVTTPILNILLCMAGFHISSQDSITQDRGAGNMLKCRFLLYYSDFLGLVNNRNNQVQVLVEDLPFGNLMAKGP